MGSVTIDGCCLFYEELGDGAPILLIHPSGATASTWGAAVDELARIGRVITYDRRGYARSGDDTVRSVARHTADAAAILEALTDEPAIVVGTSAGATITIDLAARRPDLVRVGISHEAPWRVTRHVPSAREARALASIGSLVLRRRYEDAADTLLHFAYSYRDGGSAWDAFPEAWRRAGRENARPALWDFWSTIGGYLSSEALAGIEVPVVCSYGERSPESLFRFARALTDAIPTAHLHRIHGAGHAAPFDATAHFVDMVADAMAAGSRFRAGL